MARTTLTIDTIQGNQQTEEDIGAFLLTNVQGLEGISNPYAYDVTMFRSVEAPDVDPRTMINTRATIGMRGTTGTYTYRSGVFQTFEKDSTNEQNWDDGAQTDYRVYKARIVPAFKMMDYEARYRVFEDQNVFEIIQEVMDGFRSVGPSYISTGFLDGKFAKIPYCVQFGESSMNFLSRLMAQFDIWYYFDHPTSPGIGHRELMVLGNTPAPFKKTAGQDMDVVYTAPETHEISGFQRVFVPARKSIWASDFNMLNPAHPPRGMATTDEAYDLIPQEGPAPYSREIFPAPFTKVEGDVMKDQATSRMQDEENNVFVVQGQTKNPAFLAGRMFHINKDQTEAGIVGKMGANEDTGRPAGDNYLITQMSFTAIESAYGHTVGRDVVNWIDSPVRWIWSFFRKKNLKAGLYLDTAGALASGGLANWVQNQNILHSSKPTTAQNALNPYQMNFGDTFFAGMSTSLVQGLAQMFLVNNLRQIIANHGDDYANAFMAVPYDKTKYNQVPGPDGTKPRAYGPHLAVVVGPKGITGTEDIYADVLGRVRVRFPWQRIVPSTKGYKDPPDSDEQTDPMQTDRSTCWVPVSEGWAGQQFGTQFLPRIGQQVLVSFLDGDPERPVITGRIYSADTHNSNLPFPSDAKAAVNQLSDLPPTASNYPVPFSGLKTRSTDKPQGGAERYHLLRFDDTYNCEQILLRSQGRFDVTAYANSYYTTYGTQHIKVAQSTDKDGKTFGGNGVTTIGGEYDFHVGGSRYEAVDKDYQLTVKGDVSLDFKGKLSAVVDGVASIGADTVVIEATNKITLKVGGSFIVLGPCGIYLKGPLIYENCGGSPDSSAAVTMLNVGDAQAAEPGDQPSVRLTPCSPHSPGGRGSRGATTDKIQPAPPCTQNTGSVDCDWLGDGGTPAGGGGGGGGGDGGSVDGGSADGGS